jgi:hypothetical protein
MMVRVNKMAEHTEKYCFIIIGEFNFVDNDCKNAVPARKSYQQTAEPEKGRPEPSIFLHLPIPHYAPLIRHFGYSFTT